MHIIFSVWWSEFQTSCRVKYYKWRCEKLMETFEVSYEWKEIFPAKYIKRDERNLFLAEIKSGSSEADLYIYKSAKPAEIYIELPKQAILELSDNYWPNSEFKLETYYEGITTFRELQNCLIEHNIPEANFPSRSEVPSDWYRSIGYDAQEVYTRRKDENIYESVFIVEFEKNPNIYVFYWQTGHFSDLELINIFLEFVDSLERVPENELEMLGYIATTHGSSGMDNVHDGFVNREEAVKFLESEYKIGISG